MATQLGVTLSHRRSFVYEKGTGLSFLMVNGASVCSQHHAFQCLLHCWYWPCQVTMDFLGGYCVDSSPRVEAMLKKVLKDDAVCAGQEQGSSPYIIIPIYTLQ